MLCVVQSETVGRRVLCAVQSETVGRHVFCLQYSAQHTTHMPLYGQGNLQISSK